MTSACAVPCILHSTIVRTHALRLSASDSNDTSTQLRMVSCVRSVRLIFFEFNSQLLQAHIKSGGSPSKAPGHWLAELHCKLLCVGACVANSSGHYLAACGMQDQKRYHCSLSFIIVVHAADDCVRSGITALWQAALYAFRTVTIIPCQSLLMCMQQMTVCALGSQHCDMQHDMHLML